MKKKKLKKKIKKLRKELAFVVQDSRNAFDNHSRLMTTLREQFTDLKRDFDKMAKDANSKSDANQFQFNDIYEKLKILKLRTETDYESMYKSKEKSNEQRN